MAEPNENEVADEDDEEDSTEEHSASDDAIYEFEEAFARVDPSSESGGDGSESGD